ncbi:hypothetical protein J4471_04785 [Candidatus Woesearchaeota archaeon]|nr:hypothetical protein [Candidatus Woesearchaeota archaeon]
MIIKKRGQVSTELFFAIGFILLFFMAITLINFEKNQSVKNISTDIELRNICLSIANAITNVYSKGMGATEIIKLNNHQAEFNLDNQVIMLDDSYTCTIPITDVTDGTPNTVFTITSNSLRITNLYEIVYINLDPFCITYNANYAEDSNGRKITALLKYDDGSSTAIQLKRRLNNNIPDYNQYLADHDLRIAFIDVGNACTSAQQGNILSSISCATISASNPTPDLNDRCHKYTYFDTTIQQSFLNLINSNEYNLVIIEDEIIPVSILNALSTWIQNGNILLLGGKYINFKADTRFGVIWNYPSPAIDTLTVTNQYYLNPDLFLIFASGASWSNMQKMYLTECLTCTPDAQDYSSIAKFATNVDGIARWTFGSGEVYYFSSMCHPNDFYGLGTLTIDIGTMIRNIIGVQKYGYINVTTDFQPELQYGATLENSSNLEFNVASSPWIPVSDYNYRLYEEVDNNYELECASLEQISQFNYKCNMKLKNLIDNYITTKTDFTIFEVNSVSRFINIDYQNLKVCYTY